MLDNDTDSSDNEESYSELVNVIYNYINIKISSKEKEKLC